ncbi:MAG: GyrI-like domain-containing protein [Chloroflexota bacterium]
MSVPSATPAALEVEIRGLATQPYLGRRFRTRTTDVGRDVQRGFAELFTKLAAAAVAPLGPPFLISSQPRDGMMDLELGVPCATPPAAGPLFAGTLPGGRAAVTTHRGPYDAIGPTLEALSSWIFANDHRMAGPPREVYLTGPGDVASPDQQVTELVWPIG